MDKEYKIDTDRNLKCIAVDTEIHLDILFSLLGKREFFISHRGLPSFKEHKNFCLSNPYRFWYIITSGNKTIGTFYLTEENSIGINIENSNEDLFASVLEFILSTFIPLPSQASKVTEGFHINVSPKNKQLLKASHSLGGEINQVSLKF